MLVSKVVQLVCDLCFALYICYVIEFIFCLVVNNIWFDSGP
jgi:hypothetical protein